MAVFRIEKTRDYTVMANHHLRNTKTLYGGYPAVCYGTRRNRGYAG